MNRKTIIIIPLLVAISVAAGIMIGNLLRQNSHTIYSPLPVSYGKPNKLTTILQLIEHGYVDSVNSGDIIEQTIPDILKNLDPHTAYIPAKTCRKYRKK
jgi:carboxyl-terminal processing protease